MLIAERMSLSFNPRQLSHEWHVRSSRLSPWGRVKYFARMVLLNLAGAYLFGGVTIFQFHAQGLGIPVPSELLSMLPYIATIVVLVLISRNRQLIRLNFPASLGKGYLPS